jgi:MoCo/4Fe-4S cofactor protein with predicted Tat translocation signal
MSEMKGTKQELTLEAARAKLAGQTGKKYWRSVDELADTPAFREAVQREFPLRQPSGSTLYRAAAFSRS